MPRIDALPLKTPRPTDFGPIDSADLGAGRATIADQVAAGLSVIGIVPNVDDFTDGGGRWSVDSFAAVVQRPSMSPLYPSSGVVRVKLGTSDGTLAAFPWGRVLGSDGPIVITWRSSLAVDGSDVVADDTCQYSFGVSSGDAASQIQFYASFDPARAFQLVTYNAGAPTVEALTLDVTGKTYIEVRLTIGLTGTVVEVALDGGDFVTLLTGTTAPDHQTYFPVFGGKVTSAADRALLIDRVTWAGPVDNNAGGAISSGDTWPKPAPVAYGTIAGTACEGSDARLSDSRAPTSHHASHQNGGSDEIATATPGANAIPKANGSGKLDSWISTATTSVRGLIGLAGTTPNAIDTTGSAGASGNAADALHTHAITAVTIIAAMASAAASLAMNAQKITGMADGTSATDASTKRQTDQPPTRADTTTTPSALTAADIGGSIKLSNAGAITLPTANLSSSLRSGGSIFVTIVLTGGGTLTVSDGSGCSHSGSPSGTSCLLWSDDGVTWYVR